MIPGSVCEHLVFSVTLTPFLTLSLATTGAY